jgi:putative ABC transport system permease protein
MIKTLGYNFKIAAEAIIQNKLRALLTSLGIIFGVASVISMLSIGKGAEQEILEKMKLLGTNNIIIKPLTVTQQEEAQAESEDEESDVPLDREKGLTKFSPGLSLEDGNSILKTVPYISHISPEVVEETMALSSGFKEDVKLVGISPVYFEINGFKIDKGNNFTKIQMNQALPVCIIGSGVKSSLFPTENAIGKKVKCGSQWLTVVGITESRGVSKDNIKTLGIRDYNYDVYIPVSTMLLRFTNRSLVTKEDLDRRDGRGREEQVSENYHQLDRLVVQLNNTGQMGNVADIIARMLKRRHNNVVDFEIVIPELLLQQERETKQIFNFVLGAIASISLIVGGIGIMNIMLASVLERTKEIGIRMAIGARRNDIMLQFLSEAVAISLTGGFIGIFLGIGGGYIIQYFAGIKTIISIESVLLSFFVSITVGLIFGITPARRASKQDPIDLLRYE